MEYCIFRQALKNEQNLRIAAAVGDAWPEARAKLITAFLARLDSRLKRKLQGWDSESEGGRFFLDAYPGYYISKPRWKHYSIGIQCCEYGDRMVIGVSRGTNDTRKLPLDEPLLRAVQKILPSAKSTSWWEAVLAMRSPALDWRKPDVLWRIHKDGTFLAEVADQVLEIVEVSEPIIDKMVRKNAKRKADLLT